MAVEEISIVLPEECPKPSEIMNGIVVGGFLEGYK